MPIHIKLVHLGGKIMHHLKALRTRTKFAISLILGFALVTFGCATSKNLSDPRTAFVGTWNWAFEGDLAENEYVQYVISADAVQYEFSVGDRHLSFTMSDITWIPESDPYKALYPDYPEDILAVSSDDNPYKELYQDYHAGYIIEGTITANSSYEGNIWPEGIGEIRRVPIAMHKTDSKSALSALDFCAKQL
jgi:hypothetical protein